VRRPGKRPGVDVAVADHRGPTIERGTNHLLDVLRPRGRVEQRLRPRDDVTSVQHEVADPLAELGPPWLARRDDLLLPGLEPPAEELRLRRLARAVEAFEGDEHREPILWAYDLTVGCGPCA
jgi:hypothetical protein